MPDALPKEVGICPECRWWVSWENHAECPECDAPLVRYGCRADYVRAFKEWRKSTKHV